MSTMTLPDWSPKKPAKQPTPARPTNQTGPRQPGITTPSGSFQFDSAATGASARPAAPATPGGFGAGGGIFSGGSTLGRTPSGSYSGISPTTPIEDADGTPSKEDYLATDAIFGQEQSELEAALKRLRAEYGGFSDGAKGDWTAGRLQNQYQVDFDKNLRDLGWDANANQWDQGNRLGAYGSAYNNQLEDYAGRGMLGSSAYLQALSDLNRGFDDQFSSMQTGRENYVSDLQNQFTDQFSANQSALARAKQDAYMRRAQEFNLPFNRD